MELDDLGMRKGFRDVGRLSKDSSAGRARGRKPVITFMLSSSQIACHGNRWRMHGDNLEEVKAHIHKSFDRLQAATGLDNVPTGWFCGSGHIAMKLGRAEVSE